MALCAFLKKKGFTISYLAYPEEINEIKDILEKSGVDIVPIEKAEMPTADFLIYDKPFIEREFLEDFKHKNPGSKILALDFFDYNNENVDVVVNLFNHGNPSTIQDNRHTKFICGYHVALLREGFYRVRDENRTLSQDIRKVLITFGSSDPEGHTIRVLSNISVFKDMKLIIICGSRFPHQKEIRKLLKNNQESAEIICSVEDIENWMAETDLVICGGGTTMLEAMFLGCPVLVVPQTDAEEKFARATAARGACLVTDFSLKGDFAEKIGRMKSYTLRRKLSQNAMNLVDGRGKEIIANEICEQLYESGGQRYHCNKIQTTF